MCLRYEYHLENQCASWGWGEFSWLLFRVKMETVHLSGDKKPISINVPG